MIYHGNVFCQYYIQIHHIKNSRRYIFAQSMKFHSSHFMYILHSTFFEDYSRESNKLMQLLKKVFFIYLPRKKSFFCQLALTFWCYLLLTQLSQYLLRCRISYGINQAPSSLVCLAHKQDRKRFDGNQTLSDTHLEYIFAN